MEKIQIVYEDTDVVAINKPAGISVHGDGVGHSYTIADWVLEHYPEVEGVGEGGIGRAGEPVLRPGIVHRLDKDTSGILIITKTEPSYLFLKEAFKERRVKKTYWALAWGHFKEKEGVIDVPIGRSKSDPRKRVAILKEAHRVDRKTREAVTRYKVLKELREVSLVELYPQTGRTHQLRVHLRHVGHPILGDTLYGQGGVSLDDIPRQALHARSLELTLPSGMGVTLEAEAPSDFANALARLA
jgi:23S rRNA pseudouridine1911/1915/1917 synthase